MKTESELLELYDIDENTDTDKVMDDIIKSNYQYEIVVSDNYDPIFLKKKVMLFGILECR